MADRLGQTAELAAVDAERRRWDDAVRMLGGDVVQSCGWGELQRRRGYAVERVCVDGPRGVGLAQLFFRRYRRLAWVAYLPQGPLLGEDGPALADELLAAIDDVCGRYRALSLLIAPKEPVPAVDALARTGGVRLAQRPAPWVPTRTVKVPLGDDQAILARMDAETRRKIRRAGREGVVVERWEPDAAALAAFHALYEDTARRKGFVAKTGTAAAYHKDALRIFGDDAVLMVATVAGVPVAGMIGLRFGAEAAYWKGASSATDRVRGASDYLQFEAMRWARDGGCAWYDLWGIEWGVQPVARPATAPLPPPDSRAHGLASFKLGFGGEVVACPPRWERPYHHPVLSGYARIAGFARSRLGGVRRVRGRGRAAGGARFKTGIE